MEDITSWSMDWETDFSPYGEDLANVPNSDSELMTRNGLLPSKYTYDESTGTFYLKTPCNYCRKHKLRCFIIQTTEANPNPVTSCSSCVALYRECSLAQGTKRSVSTFETDQPTLGNLHGVLEEGERRSDPPGSLLSENKKQMSKVTSRTKPLRDWFYSHQDNPYPTEADREAFAAASGLSQQQIKNWFGNARRRTRLTRRSQSSPSSRRIYRHGSPMPQQSPLDRWQNSPPEEEHCSGAVIQHAINSGANELASSSGDGLQWYQQNDYFDNSSSWFDSCSSLESLLSENSSQQSLGTPHSSPRAIFQCTFCVSSFRKRSDWIRHEKSIHVSIDSWTCQIESEPETVWVADASSAQCKYCGSSLPDTDHITSHEISSCTERNPADRKFTRRDHLLQHLTKFHHARKWEGWDWHSAFKGWRIKDDWVSSRCGFCDCDLKSWTDRYDHLAKHFRQGRTMDEWIGDQGLSDVVKNSIRNIDITRYPILGMT